MTVDLFNLTKIITTPFIMFLFGNNCTTTLYRIFPTMMEKLGQCRTVVNSYSLTRMGGKKKSRVSKLNKTVRKLPK